MTSLVTEMLWQILKHFIDFFQQIISDESHLLHCFLTLKHDIHFSAHFQSAAAYPAYLIVYVWTNHFENFFK